MYAPNSSVFSSKWKDLHTWNNCSLVFSILEYCCLIWFCNPFQSKAIGLTDSYHNLASPSNVKQNLWTFKPSWNAWVLIQSLVLRRCASASSSGLPKKSGLKWDQFNCDRVPGWIGCVSGTIGCTGGARGIYHWRYNRGWLGWGGPPLAISIYVVDHVTRNKFNFMPNITKSLKQNCFVFIAILVHQWIKLWFNC